MGHLTLSILSLISAVLPHTGHLALIATDDVRITRIFRLLFCYYHYNYVDIIITGGLHL